MTTRNEKRLLILSNQRARLIARASKEAEQRKSTEQTLGRLVSATTEQLRIETRLEKRRA